MKRLFVLVALVALVLVAADVQAFKITTYQGAGADNEFRESGDSNRGGSTEIASRVDYGVDDFGQPVGYQRNSVSYLKFDVSTMTAADLAGDITVRLTTQSSSFFASRFQDTLGGLNTGFDYFVMDNSTPGANWDEMTVTPSTAPAYIYDADVSTKATFVDGYALPATPGLTYLGQSRFLDSAMVGANPHLPVGGALDLTLAPGSALHAAIAAAQGSANETVTIVYGVIHDWTIEAQNPNWVGYNYTMNSKEKTTMNNDGDSYWGGMSEAEFRGYGGSFAPQLTNEAHPIPEPATMVLLGLGGLLLRRKR